MARVRDQRSKCSAVAEIIFSHFRFPAGDDAKLADVRGIAQTFDDVLEDGFAVHAQHRFGNFVGEFLHPRAFAGGEDDSFHESFRLQRSRPELVEQLRVRLHEADEILRLEHPERPRVRAGLGEPFQLVRTR